MNSGTGEFVFFSDATISTPSSNVVENDKIIYGCMDKAANNYNPNATKPNRSCQYGKIVATIEFGDFKWKHTGTDTSYVEVEILINNNDNIAGYQFSIEGGDVISASGGLSEDNDFIISISENMVLSFSPNEGGMFVRGGNQLLINLLIKPWDTYVCIHDIVIADVTGKEIPSLSRDCFQP